MRKKSPKFFLDAIPKEVLGNVLRFFSRLPNVKDWVPHVPLESIVELFGVTGGLGKLMKTSFHTLCISDSYKFAAGNERYRWKERESMMWTDDIDIARRFVSAGWGPSLRTIIVGLNIYGEDITEKVDDFLSNCPNITSLSIQDDEKLWLSKFGEQLQELEIVATKPSTISRHCRNLRELNLVSVGKDIGYEDFWCNVGTTIEHLILSALEPQPKELEHIKTYCRSLRHISIYGMTHVGEEFSNFLASYGNQLEYCHVENMDESALTTITSACKNVQISARVFTGSRIYPTLRVLGHRLEKFEVLSLDAGGEMFSFGDLTEAWNECGNLRVLDVKSCSIEHAKAVMGTPKQHLKRIHIGPAYGMDESEVKSFMDIFSEGTGGVEKITFIGSVLSGDSFNKLISRNRSSLREFHFQTPVPVSNRVIDVFLRLFLECPPLEEASGLRFSENTLKMLQSRGVLCFDNSGTPFGA